MLQINDLADAWRPFLWREKGAKRVSPCACCCLWGGEWSGGG